MISINKKYRTKDGDEVRLYAIDGGGIGSVHGSVMSVSGWLSFTWSESGGAGYGSHDLIEVVMIPEYWVVFEQNGTCSYVTNNEVCVDLSDNLFAIHHPAQEKPHV